MVEEKWGSAALKIDGSDACSSLDHFNGGSFEDF